MVKGSYVLLIRLEDGQRILPGRLGEIYFPTGYYAYVGSGRGGVEARVARHLRSNKKRHWHIDYLLEKACVIGVNIYGDERLSECSIAKGMDSMCCSISGFGSSDCRCRSHLFFCNDEASLRQAIGEAVDGNPAG